MRLNDILNKREETHGDFMAKALFIQKVQEIISKNSWNELEADQKESVHMILVKLSRILYGDANHADHWDDISGYAQLVANRLNKKS
ncbi:hypothetical protein UFOVP96_20 [uncultured Caudovirales phage]|uniref:DUF6378 domain-containing protein n=1 Tax=uncultured Caudovirales phage TaxID=2100421 RepID=A0A6J5L7J9_9CAUD|nr:hypothetical protein UFOVP96_20 [uncultured Caudovirales phage]